MRILIICLLILSLAATCTAAAKWPEADKTAHFGIGYIIADQLRQHTQLSFIERQLVVFLVAYGKEKCDARIDRKDIRATMLGGLVAEWRF